VNKRSDVALTWLGTQCTSVCGFIEKYLSKSFCIEQSLILLLHI